jgi:hypothetical protein
MVWSRAELFLLRSTAEKPHRQDRGGGCAPPDSLQIDWQGIAPVLQYLSVSLITLIYRITPKTWTSLVVSTFNINSERSCDELPHHKCQ